MRLLWHCPQVRLTHSNYELELLIYQPTIVIIDHKIKHWMRWRGHCAARERPDSEVCIFAGMIGYMSTTTSYLM